MARGEGGQDVFEDNHDRLDWLDRVGQCCGRFGWRIHAYVLMGNHYHLLLETPEPNLVVGMKWFMGVFSQAWNRRRSRRGHVFQGRYKAIIVNGEGSGHYFRIVADYIHLNPVRSGWVGGTTGRTLKSWRWSSFPIYANRQKVTWLETGRVLQAFELADSRRGLSAYAAYLEKRAQDRDKVLSDESLKELRRGWYLGEESFRDKLLEKLADGLRSKRKRGSVSGEGVRAHDEAEAERLVRTVLKALELPLEAAELSGRGRFRDGKALAAWWVRGRTVVSNRWLGERLAMGHPGSVSREMGRIRRDPGLARLAKRLTLQIDKMLKCED
jgi:putative transposase